MIPRSFGAEAWKNMAQVAATQKTGLRQPMDEPNNLANKSVLKALGILSALSAFPEGASATELAEATSTSRPTVFRMLLSLEAAGYVERTEGNYKLGWELIRLSRLPHLGRGLAQKLQPILDRYAGKINETVNFALSGVDGRFDIIAEGTSNRLLTIEEQFIGQQFPAHASSSGKLMLAELADEEVLAILPPRLEKFTEQTITSAEKLLAELAHVRNDGYAVLDGELETGLFSISVPVRHGSGRLMGAMAAYGPTERMKLLGIPVIAKELQLASTEVQQAVASAGPQP